jgi:Tfp pilus assembly protein PilF
MFRKALENDPNNELAHFSLGNELYENGQYQEAFKEYELALVHDPNWMRVHIQIAKCCSALGMKERALASLDAAKGLMEKKRDFDSLAEVTALQERMG